MKKIIHIVLFLAIIVQSGCSIFVSAKQRVTVHTVPDDARLFINGNEVIPPYNGLHRRSKTLSIYAEKEGYRPAQRSVSPALSTTGILDIVGTCCFLFPILGVISDGFWTLDETDIGIILIPITPVQ